MLRTFIQIALLHAALLNSCGPLSAEEWKVLFEEDFEGPDWQKNWSFKGSIGPVGKGQLTSGGKELTAALSRVFEGPAIRVAYDARFSQAGPDGEISDLSIFIGDVFFQFGGFNNLQTLIKKGGISSVNAPQRIALGKTHHIEAEINGRLCLLRINGEKAAEILLSEPPTGTAIKLYAWSGRAVFDNLRISSKTHPDPLPDKFADIRKKGHQTPQTLKHRQDWERPLSMNPKPASVKRERVALTIDPGEARMGTTWPITMGVPFPRDTVWNTNQIRIVDGNGKEVPSQRSIMATWKKNGSIRWVLLDFQLAITKSIKPLFLEYGNQVKAAEVPNPITIREDQDSIEATSGLVQLEVSRKRGTVLESVHLDANRDGRFDREEKFAGAGEAFFLTSDGRRFTTAATDDELNTVVEMAGPLRSVIRSRGWYKNEKGERACAFSRRIYLYRGLPFVRIFTTWTITVDTNVFKFRDVGLRFPLILDRNRQVVQVPGWLEGTKAAPDLAPPATLTTLGAGRYGLRKKEGVSNLLDGANWLTMADGRKSVTLHCYEMDRQSPAAIEAAEDALIFHAYRADGNADLDMTLSGLKKVWGEETYNRFENGRKMLPSLTQRNANGCGISKTHELVLEFHTTTPEVPFQPRAFRKPPIVHASPAYVCSTGVVGPGEYHPYDPARFPKQEAAILSRLDKFLSTLETARPWFGWWDYGAGIPHYLRNGTYPGYRRTYDLGYQRPLVPWMFYMRSGQRKWLEYAIRNARCMMDIRTQHWTNPPLNKHVGYTTMYGAWGWDSLNASWGFNNFLRYLLLNYYTTGYERAMDVFVEVMDAFEREKSTRNFAYCGTVGTWLGNTALAWRTTWDERFLKLFKTYEQKQILAQCTHCKALKTYHSESDEKHKHGYSHRTGWREYGFLEAMQVDEREPNLDKVFAEFGATVRPADSRTSYQTLGFSVLQAFRHSGNMLDARWGVETVDKYSGHFLTGNFGLSHLRSLPAAMKLAMVEGSDSVEVPITRTLPSPIFLKHPGKGSLPIEIRLGKQGRSLLDNPLPVEIIQPDGQPFPRERVEIDWVWGRLKMTDARAAKGIYTIQSKSGSDLSLSYPEGTLLMVGIPDGIQFGRRKPDVLWFRVPKGVERFRVRSNLAMREIKIVRPDGEELTGKKLWHEVEVPKNMGPGPWSIQSGYARTSSNFVLKLYDVPAVIALDKRSVFEVDDPPMPSPDYVGVSEKNVFVEGAVKGSKGLLINGRDRLKVDLGELTGRNRRERFNAQRGTIELYFKLNEEPLFAQATGIPLAVPIDGSEPTKAWLRYVFTFAYKNHITFRLPDGYESTAGLGPWNGPSPGMTKLQPGRWYHLALIWDYDYSIDTSKGLKRKFMHRAFLNGKPLSRDLADRDASWMRDGLKAPIPGSHLHIFSHSHNIIFDELRISDEPRAKFKDKSYPVPVKPYERDDHTLLLMHFEENMKVIGEKGQEFEADYSH